MTKENITILLRKIKKIHDIYSIANNDQKIKIFENSDFLIRQLETLGVDKTFSEALLIWGKEFLLEEYGDEEEKAFGEFKENLTENDKKRVAELNCARAFRSAEQLDL